MTENGVVKKKNGKFVEIRAELLGILVVIIFQTFGAVWWASRTEERLRSLEESNGRQSVQVEAIHQTQVEILTELARLRQAIEDSDCFRGVDS